MKKRMTALLLALTLIIGALGVPAALAEERYTASTPLVDASRNNIKNIERAIADVNGVKIGLGERFSFNGIVGARTKAKGYVSAENARGVSVTGGGVAQVATTLYLALLRLGDQVEFTDLTTYGSRFKDTYVSDGSKAVITDYSGGTDFAFINHAGDMTIELWTSSSALNCVVSVEDSDGEGDGWFDVWTEAPITTTAPVNWSASAAEGVSVSAVIPCTGDSGTLKNVEEAAESVNGTQLEPGDVFSFNEIVGPRTKKYGYGPGTNGRGARVTGGGVAQVASVLWLAVKQMDDVSVIEKSTYGKRYNQEYVDSSADAIVTDYKAEKDFSFRYNGSSTITIFTYIDNGYLHCDIADNL